MANGFVSVQVEYDYSRIEGLIEFIGEFPTEVSKAAKQAFNTRIRLGFLAQLRVTPKRRYWEKGDFASDASRRAFFAKTKGKAYVRTGNLSRSWKTFTEETDTSVAFGAENSAPYEKWVTGEQQQKGHIRTGWRSRDDRFQEWRPRTVDVIVRAIDDLITTKVSNG